MNEYSFSLSTICPLEVYVYKRVTHLVDRVDSDLRVYTLGIRRESVSVRQSAIKHP